MQAVAKNGTQASRGVIVVFCPDLFFLVGIRNTARRLGFEPHVVKTLDELEESASILNPALVLVDLAEIGDEGDWEAVSGYLRHGVPILAFGPHKAVEAFRAAKAVGVTRVVANSQFHREMAELIDRYASDVATTQQMEAGSDFDGGAPRLPPGARFG
ncbi:MAG: hypothetical protein DCC58_15455 [Chloroflexi bacterium]|nr:MAG: hypothetical protein DCC58_15455 [Chloroflexota bacterium]